eukprot:TRINITY_DN1842_c0_g2_i1.p1 TRINITY_DN1842_c0_g2~~TRINITY_DN1842_c0_g2_i1.p1  ORF type:complete len:448 (-),score=96.62 TRINITY_DN1842_c0_g2_i1:164-1507(-)
MKRKTTENDIKVLCSTKTQRKTLGELNETTTIPSMQFRHSAIDDEIHTEKKLTVNNRRELHSLGRDLFDTNKEVSSLARKIKSLNIACSAICSAQISMLEEDRAVLLTENKALSEERSAATYRIISAKNIVELSESDIENLKKTLKDKQKEVEEYGEVKDKLEQQLKELLDREQRFQEEDKLTEASIQQMKGRLYTILLLSNGLKTHSKRHGELFETLIPQKADSWAKLKFDQTICVDSLYLAQCWAELSIGVIEKVVECSLRGNDRASAEKLPREIVFFILSLGNRYAVVEEYLAEVMRNLQEETVGAAVYSLSESETMPLKSDKVSIDGIFEYVNVVKDEQSKKNKRGNNYALEVSLGESDATLKFVFIDTEDSKNLEEIQRRARDIHQTKQSNRKYTSKGHDTLMQEVLLNVNMGYLVVICEEDESMYYILQTAKTLSNCIVTS